MTTVRTFSLDDLYATGSLKWSTEKQTDALPTLGAWVAEMDFGTAPAVERVLVDNIRKGFLGYFPSWLKTQVAESTARFHNRRFGWNISEQDIRIVGAVLPALIRMITYLTRPDSAVIVPTPAYMPFLSIPRELGRQVIEVPSIHDEAAGEAGWKLNVEGIESALKEGAGLLILCNPWNPTGRVLSREELKEIHDVVSRYDALIFADEIHSPLVLQPIPFTSYASMGSSYAAHTVTATAATKGWNIAGLPNAQVIVPDEDLRARWDATPEQASGMPVPLGALGTVAAYEHGDEWQTEVLRLVNENIDRLTVGLDGTGIRFVRPEATYLTWWDFREVALNGADPAKYMREKAGVIVNAGKTLGGHWQQWARVNVACSPEHMQMIIERVRHSFA
ncbi:MalY/PatB family protein [Schaalia sp. lx-100]|uniref:MalY/PatB family protein n=1 Tax=Schaalia sp. lx-100 TaxID=2899081 RepID=UPI001E517F03|nr:aminotransferase class I/II-fold pyridoxal phosphate-dependent enzyme [Schaalia sp. lx-100]MCD4557088.1 aminotransferase class I/II-fold pyridoxal phosphate-dependent enzyme [Schaalia sp. lx-100]